MTVAPGLLALTIAAGTLAAQTSPVPPQRQWCDQQSGIVQHRNTPAGPLVVSRAFPADAGSPGRVPDSSTGRLQLDTTPLRTDQISPREAALIDSVVAMFPGAHGISIRRSLMLRASVGLSIGGDHPTARAMLDEIFAIRHARRDSAALVELRRQRAVATRSYPATLVLVGRLADSTALAQVIRRTQPSHEDLLVLPRARLTVAAFGGALHALGDMRRTTTEAPWIPESTFVHNPYVPADALQRRFDQWTVRWLGHAHRVEIPGFGRVPACAIEVTSHPPPHGPDH
ncbi:MAG: hypothetical protein ACYCVL_09400 [Gemmatimonadaceae bacterium]